MLKELSKHLSDDAICCLTEESVANKNDIYQKPKLNDSEYLIHQLQIHQIELETQNEELKRANLETEAVLKKYFDLYSLSPIGHFTLDKEGRILKVNISGEMLLGINEGVLKGKQFRTFLEIDSRPSFDTFSENLFEGKIKQKYEIVLLNSDIKPLNAYIDGFIIKDQEDHADHLLLTITDITDLRRIESELKETLLYDKLRTDFFSNISHEFRTPLNVIFATLQLIDLNKKSSLKLSNKLSLDKYLSVIKQNCRRLLRLINNLIDVTRIDSGYYKPIFQNENIVLIVNNITLSVKEFVESKGISLSYVSEMKEKEIACDPDQIERVILNIISNAVKFTKSGGKIVVALYEEQEQVVISIKDTGIGIPKNNLQDVFQRFKQIDRALTRENEGSGIGLSLIKSLIELHGGNIYVESELGKGSEFIIKLPIKVLTHENHVSRKYEDRKLDQIERINVEFSDIYS